MALTTVYFPNKESDTGYMKAIVDDKFLAEFAEMGALDSEASVKKAAAMSGESNDDEGIDRVDLGGERTVRSYVESGDIGCGAPGSYDWHRAVIEQDCINAREVNDYLIHNFGKKLPDFFLTSFNLAIGEALKTIKEILNDSNS